MSGINLSFLSNTSSGGGATLYTGFTTHTFTPGGKVGRHGPTLAQLQSTYSSQTWASNTNYFYQGRAQGYQVFQIPKTGIYEIEIAGARGQYTTPSTNGKGAIIRARIPFTTTDKLEMVVGQVPGDTGSIAPGTSYSGGGGGSFICLYGTNTPIIVAGGGAGFYSSMTTQEYINGQTRRQPLFTGYNYSPSVSGTHPTLSYGGRGYHGGGGGGWFGSGEDYPGYTNSAAMATDSSAQQYTHGAAFVGGAVSSASGPFYCTGGNSTTNAAQGGFGGGGGGHSGNNSGGGGGGYSGGLGGQTSMGGSYLSGIGGGSFIINTATSIATSDGKFDDSTVFNGSNISNIGTFNDYEGYIKITFIA
jgi:hypothetical protein